METSTCAWNSCFSPTPATSTISQGYIWKNSFFSCFISDGSCGLCLQSATAGKTPIHFLHWDFFFLRFCMLREYSSMVYASAEATSQLSHKCLFSFLFFFTSNVFVIYQWADWLHSWLSSLYWRIFWNPNEENEWENTSENKITKK